MPQPLGFFEPEYGPTNQDDRERYTAFAEKAGRLFKRMCEVYPYNENATTLDTSAVAVYPNGDVEWDEATVFTKAYLRRERTNSSTSPITIFTDEVQMSEGKNGDKPEPREMLERRREHLTIGIGGSVEGKRFPWLNLDEKEQLLNDAEDTVDLIEQAAQEQAIRQSS
jgi:hypothetical protein